MDADDTAVTRALGAAHSRAHATALASADGYSDIAPVSIADGFAHPRPIGGTDFRSDIYSFVYTIEQPIKTPDD